MSVKNHQMSQLYEKIGYCYQESGDYEEALKVLQKGGTD